jgi:hypothetical protein
MIVHLRRSPNAALIGVLLSAALVPAIAPSGRADTALGGVQLMSSFRDVMKKFGQPAEIYVGWNSTSEAGGGQTGAGGFGSRRAGGGGLGARPGGGLPGGFGGGGLGGMRGSAGSGPTLPGFGGTAPTGPPGFGGGPTPMGGIGGARRGGLAGGMRGGRPGGAAGAAAANPEDEDPHETTWWYHDVKKGLHYSFLFNNKGKVIQIQEFGWKGGFKTTAGVGLGATLGQIIKVYGWTDNGVPGGEDLVLRYGKPNTLMLQLHNNKLVGITIGIVQPPPPDPEIEQAPVGGQG